MLIALCLLLAGGALSGVAATAMRVCYSGGTKRVSSGKHSFTGGYRPLGAAFTGTVKSKKKSSSRVK